MRSHSFFVGTTSLLLLASKSNHPILAKLKIPKDRFRHL